MVVSVDYSVLPPHLRSGAKAYVERRVRPGHFLLCALENDLANAVLSADCDTLAAISDVAQWLRHDAPRECWGSQVAADAWLTARTGGSL